jgi:DNA-binding XRE family transcriptional regulator
MSTAATDEQHPTPSEVSEQIVGVSITDPSPVDEGKISFRLKDGRVISVPLSWSWRLQEATPEERQNYRISPSGYGVHWPDVDEDLSARGALRGTPAPRPNTSPPADEPPTDWTPGQIKRVRTELGLSQKDFAERMGVRQATVSDWETGKQTPSRMARRLLDRFNGAVDNDRVPA